MSGSGFLGPHNTTRRAPPPPCTVFFYAWRCGHREWVHCLGCDVAGGPSTHLGHPHLERQLPAPRHRCSRCNQPSEHEMALAPLLGESLSGLARRNIQILRRENNHPEIIGVRIARDVAATMDVWREPPATSGMTTEQLRTMIAINIEDDRANIEENRQFWEDFRATPASLRTQLPPTLAPLPQPLVNGWPNGPVQAAPPRGLSGGHRADGRALGYQVNGVHTNGPWQHHGSNGGRGFPGRGTQRGQATRGPRGGPGRSQHTTQPRQPSQLRNGYLPDEDEFDGQQSGNTRRR